MRMPMPPACAHVYPMSLSMPLRLILSTLTQMPMLLIQNGAFCSLFADAHASAYAYVSACPHAHAHTHVSFPNVSAYTHDLSPSPLAKLFVDSFANCYSLATIQDE
jgi:hypothetical protein